MNEQKEKMLVKYKLQGSGQEAEYSCERSLDLILSPGCYIVEIDHTATDVGLPFEFCGSEHYIVGSLVVTDNGTKGAKQNNRLTGQALVVTLQGSTETKIYIRTFANGEWGEWRSLAFTGMYDKISTTDELLASVEELVSRTNTIHDEQEKGNERTKSIEEKVDIIMGKVLNATGYINKNGIKKDNENYRCSDYHFITCKSDIVVKKGYAGESSLLLAFYDKDKNFISGINNASEIHIPAEEIPENAVYVRFSSMLPVDDIVISFTDIVEALEWAETAKQIKTLAYDVSNNLADVFVKDLPLSVAGFYNTEGYSSSSENARKTELITIAPYKRLVYRTSISATAAAVCFFDEAKNCIPELSIAGTSTLSGGIIDLTQQAYQKAKYVSVSYYDVKKLYTGFIARLYNDDALELRLEKVEKVNAIMPITRNLNILIFGDSITSCSSITTNEYAQTTAYYLLENSNSYMNDNNEAIKYSMWPYLITKYLPCADVRNYAMPGASYKEQTRESGYDRQNLSYQIQLALNDKSNPYGVFPTIGEFIPDVIIFALGTNDGSPNDTYDSAMEKTVMSADGQRFDIDATLANLNLVNTCEAIRFAFIKIKRAFPQSLCFCVLPIQRASCEQPGINDALRKMANRYSMKVIDGYSELGIVRDLEVCNGLGENLKDGLHPNEKGQLLFTRMIVNAIKNNWFDLAI